MSDQQQSPGSDATPPAWGAWQTWLRLILSVMGPVAVALIAISIFKATNDDFDIGLAGVAGNGAPALIDTGAEARLGLLAAERRARLMWATSIVCLSVASVAAVVMSLWIIAATLAGKVRRTLLLCLAAMTAAMVTFIWGNDVSLEFTREGILEPTVGLALGLSESGFTLDRFALSRNLTNSISTAATTAIVFAIIAATQVQPLPAAGVGFEQRARRFARQMHHLSVLLYAAAALLVTVVLSMAAWLLWPVALAGTAEIEARLLEIASGIGLFWGASFTLILAAAYVPSALWLNGQIRALSDMTEDPSATATSAEQRRSTMARFGLNKTVFSQVTQLVAIMSPLFSGALPFLNTLT